MTGITICVKLLKIIYANLSHIDRRAWSDENRTFQASGHSRSIVTNYPVVASLFRKLVKFRNVPTKL